MEVLMSPIPHGTNRLLIDMPSWLGDCIMATPVLRAARTALPEARIVVLVRPGLDRLLAGCPFVDEWIALDPRGVAGVWRRAKVIRAVRPDAALLLPNSFRAALALRLSGTRIRAGYARDARGFLLTHGLAFDKRRERPIATLEYYLRLAKWSLGVESIDPAMHLAVSEEDRAAAASTLRGVTGPFVVLNPGGNKPGKRWPAEQFAVVGRALSARHGVRVVVNGSPGEREIVRDVCAGVPDSINLVERGVTLGALKGVIERALLVITNDTGPRHIAAALGTPLVTLFGPTDPRWTTLPGIRERIITADPFLPEELVADDVPERCAIGRIPASDVIHAAEAIMGQVTAGEGRGRPLSKTRGASEKGGGEAS